MPRRKGSEDTVAGSAIVKSQEISHYLMTGKRDAAGFLEGDQPSLTYNQVIWLTHRMGVDNDEDATAAAGLDEAEVYGWKDDLGFLAVYDVAIRNKREAFKILGTQLLPNALRTIAVLLSKAEMGDIRAAQTGLNMLLRSQALLIDKISTDSSDKVDQLMEMLRQQAPVQVINMEPR